MFTNDGEVGDEGSISLGERGTVFIRNLITILTARRVVFSRVHANGRILLEYLLAHATTDDDGRDVHK